MEHRFFPAVLWVLRTFKNGRTEYILGFETVDQMMDFIYRTRTRYYKIRYVGRSNG